MYSQNTLERCALCSIVYTMTWLCRLPNGPYTIFFYFIKYILLGQYIRNDHTSKLVTLNDKVFRKNLWSYGIMCHKFKVMSEHMYSRLQTQDKNRWQRHQKGLYFATLHQVSANLTKLFKWAENLLKSAHTEQARGSQFCSGERGVLAAEEKCGRRNTQKTWQPHAGSHPTDIAIPQILRISFLKNAQVHCMTPKRS